MIIDRTAVWSTALDDLKRTAAFVLGLDVALAILMGLLRNGMPGIWGLVAVSAALSTFACTAPFHFARVFPTARLHLLLFGPMVFAAGLVALVLTYFGPLGAWAIVVAAVVSATPVVWVAVKTTSIRSATLWLCLLAFSTALLGLDFAGTKYAGFFADQLALYGRTDGDQFYQGALVASILNFGFPTTAIDGLQPLRYHVAFDWVAARVLADVSGDAISAVVASKIFFLVPLAWFAMGLAASIWRAALMPQIRIAPIAAIGSVALFLVVATYLDVGSIVYESESMLTGAALGLLVFPGVLLLALDTEVPRTWRMIAIGLCGLSLWPLAAGKISTALVFGSVFGILMLLAHGLRKAELWLAAMLSVLAFGAGLWMFSDPHSEGADWTGPNYYFEYGFDRGNWLLPVAFHVETILALLLLWRLWSDLSAARKYALAALLVGTVAANIPVLLVRVENGGAAYFLYAQAWLATTVNVALFVPFWIKATQRLRSTRSWLPAGVATLLVIAIIVQGASYATWRFNGFVSESALLRTGDRSYYADDKKRVWRDDRKRALKDIGLLGILAEQPPQPFGAALAGRLQELRTELGTSAAVFVPVENETYWAMARDCDAKSLFPIALAGLAQVLGYYADQDSCEQNYAYFGFPPPPAQSTLHQAPEAVCRRALETGFREVIWVASMAAEDVRVIPCAPN